jgi:DNA repair exonuclease SbcCD ATPase subunit
MSNEDVLAHLRELHDRLEGINEELGKAGEVDEETIEALGVLINDVGTLFDQAKDIQERDHAHQQQHLQDRIAELEANHPMLTGFLSRITDVLAMMGI